MFCLTTSEDVMETMLRGSSTAHSSGSSSFSSLYVLIIMILIMLSSTSSPALAKSAYEFTAYRMNEYDLQSKPYGCRNSILNLEARTWNGIGDSFARKCVVLRLTDLLQDTDRFMNLLGESITGGVLILIPESWDKLTDAQRESLGEFEEILMAQVPQIPVYFAQETEQLSAIYEDIENSISNEPQSPLQKITSAVFADRHQITVVGPKPAQLKNVVITNFQAKLAGSGVEDQLPSIVLVAHYDAFSVAPNLSHGAISNASGMVVLLELLRIFAKIYSNSKTQPKVNLAFVLTGGGRYGFLGAERWIKYQQTSAETNLLHDALYTICLDSLASMKNGEDGNRLFLHVAKPPREGSSIHRFVKDMEHVTENLRLNANVTLNHKKINLADDRLSWEHERFSLNRLASFTLSSLPNPRVNERSSIADRLENLDIDSLVQNIQIIAHTVARQLVAAQELPDPDQSASLLSQIQQDIRISKPYIKATLETLASQPRPQQLLLTTVPKGRSNSPVKIESPQLLQIESLMSNHLKDGQLTRIHLNLDDTPLIFYEPTSAKMTAYNVKPAIFDLFLLLAVSSYLGIFYLVTLNFDWIIKSLTGLVRSKSRENGHTSSSYSKKQKYK